MWINSLLRELGFLPSKRPVVWCDNLSTVSLSANPIQHARTKHIEIDLYFVREQTASGKMDVNHVPAQFQRADALTKPLSLRNFVKFREEMKIEEGGGAERR